MDFQNRNNTANKFVCPSDRQLALRAKLKAGWSSSKITEPLRPDEQEAIISVIKRNEEIESAERQRVGRLVERVEKIKQHAVERGPNCCRLCGDTFGLLRPQRIICEDCKKSVCTKCSVDISIRYQMSERVREIWLCRICSETREMWKKSGAWFFRGLPNYEMPRSAGSTPTHHLVGGGGFGGGSGGGGLGISTHNSRHLVHAHTAPASGHHHHSCHSTPSRIKKLTIRVNDSSSSAGSSNSGSRHGSDAEDHDEPDGVTGGGLLRNGARCNRNGASNGSSEGASNGAGIEMRRLQREDSFRLRTFGSIRSFISDGERKLSNSFFFNRQTSKTENNQPDYDNISTITMSSNSANATNGGHSGGGHSGGHSSGGGGGSNAASGGNNAGVGSGRCESNFVRRGSVSSSWSISDSSGSGNSGGCGAGGVPCSSGGHGGGGHLNQHCRDQLLGWLEISICYRESYHCLDCTMVRARDLPAMDASGLTDPYCKLNIVTPEGHTKYTRWQRTKTVHKTRNPEFNETLQFVGVEPEELGNSLLHVTIFDDDKYGHDFLGAAKVCLSTVHNTNQYRLSVPLGAEDKYSNEAELAQDWPNGKLLLSLCYNTKKRALVVNVKQCINLLPMDNNGSSDPFVKLHLKPDPHKNKKHKTSVKWRTLNPIFNEEFYFEASPHDLNKETLILTVWDKDIGKSNDFLGSLLIGYQSKGERLQQWHDCIRLPDHRHEKWHCLAADNPTH